MNFKAMTVCALTLAAVGAFAAGGRGKPRAMAGSDGEMETTGKAAKILIDQMPRTGRTSCFSWGGVTAPSQVCPCYKKPRQWIVLETKYTTYGTETSRFLDQLTFTWHVLLETKSATENKGNHEKLAPYSYFTTSTTYYNIPYGTHAASVVLPPSYLERYGEPKAVGFVITNEKGEELGGGTVSEVKGIKNNDRFWEDKNVMDAKDKAGEPFVERRQGLLDRSKTIWALAFPNDFETTIQ